MIRKLASAAVAVTLMSAGIVAVAASPAAAAADAQAFCDDTWDSEYGYWTACGDAFFKSEDGSGNEHLYLYDDSADGYGVVVENYRYDLADTGPYYGWVTAGKGHNNSWTLHIPEDEYIQFRVCPEKGGTIYDNLCGEWVWGQA
jgi:opacity protein-like surface antigen